MKIMVDTNVLISALVFGGKAREILLMLIGTEHKIYVSDYFTKAVKSYREHFEMKRIFLS